MSMILVIPCFNEARRLDEGKFLESGKQFQSITFVDDGSTDRTPAILAELQEKIRQQGGGANLVLLPKNQGKAEAVRQGVLSVLNGNSAKMIAVADADLATPLGEMVRLGGLLERRDFDVLQGARVQLFGREIERSPLRHYVGRMAATLISAALNLKIYDTQAGAKVFSWNAATALFADEFVSPWLFDCEIFLRAQAMHMKVCEEPLMVWRDQDMDSKVKLNDYFRSLIDLLRIRKAYRDTIS